MRCVVSLSGVGSWAAGRRVVDRYGSADLDLLFTDTRYEDDDTYAFVRAAAANLGGRLHWIADGRTVWEVFRDERMIGNTRADVCSRVLKRELADNPCEAHHTDFQFGRDRSAGFNGLDQDSTRKRDEEKGP